MENNFMALLNTVSQDTKLQNDEALDEQYRYEQDRIHRCRIDLQDVMETDEWETKAITVAQKGNARTKARIIQLKDELADLTNF